MIRVCANNDASNSSQTGGGTAAGNLYGHLDMERFPTSLFKFLERDTEVNELSERSFYIVSCGGGTPCFNNNIDIINQLGMSVYIKLSTDTLYERLKSEKMNRPLIANLTDSKMKLFIDKTLKQRAVFYEKAIEIFNSELQSEEKFVKRLNDFIV